MCSCNCPRSYAFRWCKNLNLLVYSEKNLFYCFDRGSLCTKNCSAVISHQLHDSTQTTNFNKGLQSPDTKYKQISVKLAYLLRHELDSDVIEKKCTNNTHYWSTLQVLNCQKHIFFLLEYLSNELRNQATKCEAIYRLEFSLTGRSVRVD